MNLRRYVFAAVLALPSSLALGYDCNSDCSGGGYSYPCPNWGNPGKMCHGDLPNDPACLTAKEASCQIWESAVSFATPKVRPFLEGKFNHNTWAAAQSNGSTDQYQASCVAAGVAAFGALGAELGGVWGGVMSGAVGTFVSFRVCDQSKAW